METETPGKMSDAAEVSALASFAQTVWPTFFNLASMSFAWNASLAAGTGYLMFSQGAVTAAASIGGANDVVARMAIALCAIAIVYNLGAFCAYAVMARTAHEILVAQRLAAQHRGFEASHTLYVSVLSGKFWVNALGILTFLFFLLLLLGWVWGLFQSIGWLQFINQDPKALGT